MIDESALFDISKYIDPREGQLQPEIPDELKRILAEKGIPEAPLEISAEKDREVLTQMIGSVKDALVTSRTVLFQSKNGKEGIYIRK